MSFDQLDFLKFAITSNERCIIVPFGGRQSVLDFAHSFSLKGQVRNKGLGTSHFQSQQDLQSLMRSEAAHSEWYVSFSDGSRAFLDWEDDFAVILFDESKRKTVSSIFDAEDLYDAALHENRIREEMQYDPLVIRRMDQLISIALRDSGKD